MIWFLWLTGAAQNASAATQLLGIDFESGTLASICNLDLPGTILTIQSSVDHGGTKALKYAPGTGTTTGCTIGITPSTTVYAKWWWWVASTIVGGPGRHGFRITKRIGDQFTSHWQLDTVMESGGGFSIDILFQDDGVDSGTTYHGLFTLPTNQWFQFEILTTLNTPGLANGVLTLWINGVQRFTASNVTYRSSGSSMNGYDTFALVSNFDGAGTESYWYMDDVQVWDGFPGLPPPPNLRFQ